MILAVLDTNVLVSGTLSSTNAPGKILDAWQAGLFILVTSAHIISELEQVFQKPYFQKHVTHNQVKEFIDLLRSEALIAPITANVQAVATHSEDDLVFATAVSSNAKYLVTGDGPLLRKVGNEYQDVTLLTPNDFLKKLM